MSDQSGSRTAPRRTTRPARIASSCTSRSTSSAASSALLPEQARQAACDELAELIDDLSEAFPIRAYSTVGVRADADFMLWKVSERLEDFQEAATAIARTDDRPHLETTYAYLSMTRRSQYVKARAARCTSAAGSCGTRSRSTC